MPAKKQSRYPEEWGDLPSVTETLECIPKPGLIAWYKRTPYAELKKSSDESMAIGTAVNDLVDAWESGKTEKTSIEVDASLAPRIVSAVKRYMEWRKTKNMTLVGSQIKVRHSLLGYVGTIDRLEKTESGLYIIDWKVAKKLYLTYKLQVLAYKYAYEFMHNEKIAGCYLIRLDKENLEFNPEKDVVLVEDHEHILFGMFCDLLKFFKVFRTLNDD